MLQILYVSSRTPGTSAIDMDTLLDQARRNNRRDGITGLLYTDSARFLQVLEGPEDKVAALFARLADDPRHRALMIVSRRHVAEREFGDWSMALLRPGETGPAFQRRVETLCEGADPSVLDTVASVVRARLAVGC